MSERTKNGKFAVAASKPFTEEEIPQLKESFVHLDRLLASTRESIQELQKEESRIAATIEQKRRALLDRCDQESTKLLADAHRVLDEAKKILAGVKSDLEQVAEPVKVINEKPEPLKRRIHALSSDEIGKVI